MKNFFLGAFAILLVVLGLNYFENRKEERQNLEESSALIQQQLQNVGKLIVTEGSLSQVYSYNDSRKFYLDVLSARKKALIIVNAKVSVAYDLSKMELEIDEENRRVLIKHIPEEELSISPDIKYYDVTQDYLNQFTASDYNKIKKRIDASLKKKVEGSNIISNAQNRLISELQKIYILTSSMGWTLEYKQQELDTPQALESLKL